MFDTNALVVTRRIQNITTFYNVGILEHVSMSDGSNLDCLKLTIAQMQLILIMKTPYLDAMKRQGKISTTSRVKVNIYAVYNSLLRYHSAAIKCTDVQFYMYFYYIQSFMYELNLRMRYDNNSIDLFCKIQTVYLCHTCIQGQPK